MGYFLNTAGIPHSVKQTYVNPISAVRALLKWPYERSPDHVAPRVGTCRIDVGSNPVKVQRWSPERDRHGVMRHYGWLADLRSNTHTALGLISLFGSMLSL